MNNFFFFIFYAIDIILNINANIFIFFEKFINVGIKFNLGIFCRVTIIIVEKAKLVILIK